MPIVPEQAIELRLKSCPAHLPVARAAVERMCDLVGFDERDTGAVMMAVDEALANIIEHAYQGQANRPIELKMLPLVDGDRQTGLEIRLRDAGKVVQLGRIQGRSLDAVRPGGLGTHIMGCCMDEVEYSHPAGGGTELRMVKLLASSEPGTQPEMAGE